MFRELIIWTAAGAVLGWALARSHLAYRRRRRVAMRRRRGDWRD